MGAVAITPPEVLLELSAGQQLTNYRIPAWLRVWCWALAHCNDHGHAPALATQLSRDLGISPRDVSRALAIAKSRRLIDDSSFAGCVVLTGYGHGRCDANHRDL